MLRLGRGLRHRHLQSRPRHHRQDEQSSRPAASTRVRSTRFFGGRRRTTCSSSCMAPRTASRTRSRAAPITSSIGERQAGQLQLRRGVVAASPGRRGAIPIGTRSSDKITDYRHDQQQATASAADVFRPVPQAGRPHPRRHQPGAQAQPALPQHGQLHARRRGGGMVARQPGAVDLRHRDPGRRRRDRDHLHHAGQRAWLCTLKALAKEITRSISTTTTC